MRRARLFARGVGIDLVAAPVVIHYDRWWNTSKENYATDRGHRIEQKSALSKAALTDDDPDAIKHFSRGGGERIKLLSV